ncbi:MAG: protein phosphatase 2C domain-containing protein [Hyphomonadaceae bacterium]
MKLIDQIASPGSHLGGGLKSGTGDDRYVFDEGAGWACVIDGATDVGPVRVFRAGESDAARFAEMFAARMIAHPARPDETPMAYFARFAQLLSAAVSAEAIMPLADAPRSSWPTAAAAWVRVRNTQLEAAMLGDCLVLVRTPEGAVRLLGRGDKPADEQARAREVMRRTPEERLKWLQAGRATHNTEGAYWIFGVQPEAAAHILIQTAPCPPGAHVLLVTDGFYRLVSPYGRYDDDGLFEAVLDKGLGVVLAELRGLEADPGDDQAVGRIKTSDDATALLFEIGSEA